MQVEIRYRTGLLRALNCLAFFPDYESGGQEFESLRVRHLSLS